LAMEGSGSGQNPVSSPGFLAGEGVGEIEGLIVARFARMVGAGRRSAEVVAGAGGQRERVLLSRRGGGSVGKMSESASFSWCKRSSRVARVGMRLARTWGSPQRPLMAPADRGSGNDSRARGEEVPSF
jgi:hypothetical protein